MTIDEQREAARQFYYRWRDKGQEDQYTSKFWLDLLQSVFGISNVDYIDFEKRVYGEDGNVKRIDGYIPETKVVIEQKSSDIALDKPQIGHNGDTPYQQAWRYNNGLPANEKAQYIITSNFKEIWIYDMNKPQPEKEVQKVRLEDLQTDIFRLEFLVRKEASKISKEMEVSMQAGELVGLLYDELYKSYAEPNEDTLKSLNKLCVRLVFCMYAEDAGLFGKKNMFHDYLVDVEPKHMRRAIKDLFIMLNTPEDKRDPDEDSNLLAFPYVNGGLFEDDNISIPQFTEELKELLLEKASNDFDWSDISPTIFGAIFESTLNPETRRSGGMHYTSIENIHKVIDPLFLDDLKKELEEIKEIKNVGGARTKALQKFQDKIASLKFLDPAAGSGNFLTESYTSLRKLENQILRELKQDVATGQMTFGFVQNEALLDIKVSIQQFYGIEINDFAVTVAKTALWIAEAQMLKETMSFTDDIGAHFLPLKTYVNIVEGNALRIDWNDVLPAKQCSYIMGNPPFVGFTYMTESQKNDMELIFPNVKNLDFVCAWYKKANDYIKGTSIEAGFVSTNSISQGETVARLWEFLDFKINFAYQTFIWNSEANDKAHVHCVIVGFSDTNKKNKLLFNSNSYSVVNNINPYLIDAPNIVVKSRNIPICNVSKMVYGNKPADGGYLIIENEDYHDFIKKDSGSEKYIRPFVGAVELLHKKNRWCLWLKGVSPSELNSHPLILDRISKCKETRLNSKAAGIRKFATTPSIFAQITQPEDMDYIIIPRVSSERRRYIPMDFMKSDVIVSDAVQIVPNATVYEFGILESNVHMAWMRAVCGRLKSDYRYSKDIVYNNFPWPTPTEEQKKMIEKTAQGILDARALYPDSSLADLYDPLLMPPELQKAHTQNDIAVMRAYGFNIKEMSEADCVAELMKMYQKLVDKENIDNHN